MSKRVDHKASASATERALEVKADKASGRGIACVGEPPSLNLSRAGSWCWEIVIAQAPFSRAGSCTCIIACWCEQTNFLILVSSTPASTAPPLRGFLPPPLPVGSHCRPQVQSRSGRPISHRNLGGLAPPGLPGARRRRRRSHRRRRVSQAPRRRPRQGPGPANSGGGGGQRTEEVERRQEGGGGGGGPAPL